MTLGALKELAALVLFVSGKTNLYKARKEFNFRMLEIHGYDSEISTGLSETQNGFGLIAQF